MRKLFLLCTMLLGMSAVASAQTGNPALDALRARFDKGELFYSQLHHQFIDSYTGDTLTTLGQVWIDKNRYKLEMPTGVVIVDGATSHVFNSDKNQVILSPYDPEEDDYAPSRFLYGPLDTYKVLRSYESAGNNVVVISSDDAFALFEEIVIELSPQAEPVRIVATDQSGNVILSRFSFGKFVPNDDQLFLLSYPKSAEIIDLRQ